MRKGPHPLPVHLGMIASNMEHAFGAQHAPSDILGYEEAVELMRGIKLYQEHPYKAPVLDTQIVWKADSVRVVEPVMAREQRTEMAQNPPLLLVPSMINKSHILDLTQELSILRWFAAQNVPTYLLDWGYVPSETRYEAVLERYLAGAIKHLSAVHEQPVNVLGHCMGGTLLLNGMPHYEEEVNRVILLAAPWRFNDPSFKLGRDVRLYSAGAKGYVEAQRSLPSEWMQTLFAGLDPKGSAQKFIKFASMDQESDAAKDFIAVEDWLNDGVDLSYNVAQHVLDEWFMASCPDVTGIDTFKHPVFIMASAKDKLVPYNCAVAAKEAFCRAPVTLCDPGCGHISMIVGRHAKEKVWLPIRDWLLT